MTTTMQLFIGSNNETQQVETELLEQTLAKRHQGFTIQPSVGYWQGSKEDSVIVTLSDEFDSILETIHELKQVLNQDAIVYNTVAPLEFI